MSYAEYIQIVIGVVLTLSFIVASFQLRLFRKQSVDQYEWLRREKTLEYSLSKNKDLQQQRKCLDELFGSIHRRKVAIPKSEIDKKLKDDKTAYTVISTLLAHWENLALAIELDIADKQVAFEMTAGIVIDYVKAFHYFIEDRRENNNPLAYEYLRDLAKEWEDELAGKNKIDRKKFPKNK